MKTALTAGATSIRGRPHLGAGIRILLGVGMLIDVAHRIGIAAAAGSQHPAETGGVIHKVILEGDEAAGLETRSLTARSLFSVYEVQLVREMIAVRDLCPVRMQILAERHCSIECRKVHPPLLTKEELIFFLKLRTVFRSLPHALEAL